MILQNISPNPITVAGSYTIPAGGTLTVPYSALEDDRTVIGYIDAQELRIVDAEESFTFRSIPRFTQGLLFPSQTLEANETYTPTLSDGVTPVVLWVAPFQNVRVYLNVTSGDMTVTVQDSPDGGTTFFPIPDAPVIQAQASDANGGKVSAILPGGLCLLKFILTSQNGGTASVSYARQS